MKQVKFGRTTHNQREQLGVTFQLIDDVGVSFVVEFSDEPVRIDSHVLALFSGRSRRTAAGRPQSVPTFDIAALCHWQNLEHLPESDRAALPQRERATNRKVLECSPKKEKLDAKTGSMPWLESIPEWHNRAKREVLAAGAGNATVLSLPNRLLAAALCAL